jgi:hypothetical protein
MSFHINTDKKQIKTFGIGLSVLLIIAAVLNLVYKHNLKTGIILSAISALILVFSFLISHVLKPIYIPIMFVGQCIGWVNTRLLLGLIFYLIFTPIAVFFRIINKDILDKKIDPAKDSHWFSRIGKKSDPIKDFEKQF